MTKSHSSGSSDKKDHKEPASPLQIKTDEVCNYCKLHYKEIVAYGLMILGIFLFFFDSPYGGVLIGLVGGVYFGKPIVSYLMQCKKKSSPRRRCTASYIDWSYTCFFHFSALYIPWCSRGNHCERTVY